ncbi:MAG: DUF1616 domain-containing protein [Gammaproteobacteria bacterium]
MALSNNREEIVRQTVRNDKPETIQQLITMVTKKVPMPRKDIMKIILKLQKEEKIAFHKPSLIQKPQKPGSYLKTREAYWYWATVGLTALSAIAVFGFQAIGVQGLIRFAPGAILVLGLPGYSLTRIFFPAKFTKKRKTPGADNITFFALSVVLSIVLNSLVGLVLNYTEWGIQLISLILSLSFLTVSLATAAAFQEKRNFILVSEVENGK